MTSNEYQYSDNADFYCYPNTSILVNQFDIRDSGKLHETEKELTAINTQEALEFQIKGNFDLNHLKAIHKFIFGDIYEWAGKIRGGDFLSKGDSIFCRAMFIESMANEIHQKLQAEKYLANLEKAKFISRLAFYMGEINALHPFREGNGRTQRVYFGYLCQNAGYGIEFSKVDKDVLLQADIGAFNRNYDLLVEILNSIVAEQR